jgi:hypothetical protein
MPCNVIPLDRALASLSSVARRPPREAHRPRSLLLPTACGYVRGVRPQSQESVSDSITPIAKHFQGSSTPAPRITLVDPQVWRSSKCWCRSQATLGPRFNGREPLRLFLSTLFRLVPGYLFVAQASRLEGTTIVYTMPSGTHRPAGRGINSTVAQ